MTRDSHRGGSSEVSTPQVGAFEAAEMALTQAIEAVRKCARLTRDERNRAFDLVGQINDEVWETDWAPVDP